MSVNLPVTPAPLMIVNLAAITAPQNVWFGNEWSPESGTEFHHHASLPPNTAITSITPDEHPRSSTILRPHSEEIGRKLWTLLEAAQDETFEDGMESDFSKGLTWLIQEYGTDAVEALAYFIVYEKADPEVSAETLRRLGLIEHPKTYNFRLWLLERSLQCSHARVRDAAGLGLSFLDDSHAVPYIRHAIEKELVKMLREDLQQVLDQLESHE
jgi:hypothetical protein